MYKLINNSSFDNNRDYPYYINLENKPDHDILNINNNDMIRITHTGHITFHCNHTITNLELYQGIIQLSLYNDDYDGDYPSHDEILKIKIDTQSEIITVDNPTHTFNR